MEPGQLQSPVPAAGANPHGDSPGDRPKPERIAFTGGAVEYFGIWLANIVLSILTLGIFSAWAKVRRNRYFLGNTRILGDALEYHATGKMILKGRLIAFAVIVAYYGIGMVSPMAQGIASIALLPLYPWVINRALRFNARMTSWRNFRFEWHGEYWGIVKVYFLWPFAALFTLGALGPMAARAGREYLANNYALGSKPFDASTPIGPYYAALLKTVIFGVITIGLPIGLAATFVDDWSTLEALFYNVGLWTFLPLLVLAWFGMIMIYFKILARNILINALVMGGVARFGSDIDALRYQWILLSNFAVSVCTAFLMYPWALVRSWRYQAQCVAVQPLVSAKTFVDTETAAGHAFGEEFGEMEGIDIGI